MKDVRICVLVAAVMTVAPAIGYAEASNGAEKPGAVPASVTENQSMEIAKAETADTQASTTHIDLDSKRASVNTMEIVIEQEPPLRIAIAAALDYAEFDPDDTAKWKANARKRNWLPDVRTYARRRQWPADVFTTVNDGTTIANDIHLSDREANLESFGVEFRWEFKNLRFDPEQIDISEETRRRASQRNDLIEDITKLYYKRIAMLVKLAGDTSALSVDELIELKLDAVEITHLMNALCDKDIFDAPK